MREAFGGILSNEMLRTRLRDDILESTLSHAYIIEGKKGSGKHTIAKLVAAALSCQHKNDADYPLPCLECPSCRKILSGNSPDVIMLNAGEGKTTIGVDVIRNLQSDVCIEPNELDNKIYVIENAHTMTPAAQNAFLLTLEEPPSYVLFLLLSENCGQLLETVRSRAPLLRTQPVNAEDMRQYLTRHAQRFLTSDPGIPGETADEVLSEIISASDGCIGRALELSDKKSAQKIIALRQSVSEFITSAASHEPRRIIGWINNLPTKRDEVSANIEAILPALRDLILLKKSDSAPLCFYTDRERALDISDSYTVSRLYTLYDAVSDAYIRISQRNANIRLTLISTVSGAKLL